MIIAGGRKRDLMSVFVSVFAIVGRWPMAVFVSTTSRARHLFEPRAARVFLAKLSRLSHMVRFSDSLETRLMTSCDQ
jgi:hypothetical protein